MPGALSLALFAWLLSLHPRASSRVYAADSGVCIAAALAWLWAVDGVRPSTWDLLGSALASLGMGIIVWASRSA